MQSKIIIPFDDQKESMLESKCFVYKSEFFESGENMYQSKRYLDQSNPAKLKKYLSDFLKTYKYIKCKSLKGRKVFLDKLPEIIIKRTDYKNRLECFWVAINILKKSSQLKQRYNKGFREYEIIGLSAEGKKVFIHLREEKIKKDRKVFLLSTYYKN